MMIREKNIKALNQKFDLLIVGGGVTGAGIALDAASRGLKTALVEKDDFASGTSSRSTKLVHGGLRYLKQLEIGLVSEVGRERAIVHRNAPHLVIPEKMLMPLIKGGTYGKISTALGLTVYDILAGVRKSDRREMLSREKALQTEPLLNPEKLVGAGFYSEYRTDDARLTIELIKAAGRYGAVCLNYMEMTEFIIQDGKLCGGVCQDLLGKEELYIKAKYVVNACGPWVDVLREMNNSLSNKRLHLTKGVHLVIPHEKMPVNHSIYFDVPDDRMIFAIPRGNKTYIGTTDTDYKGSLDRIVSTEADALYLIKSINDTFPDINIHLEDVDTNWAGLRPLIHQEGKTASEISRRDEIFEAEDGLTSIAGGKLSGYRKMAEKTVDLVAKKYHKDSGKKLLGSITENLTLLPDHLKEEDLTSYKTEIKERLQSLGIGKEKVEYLISNYGKQSDMILDLVGKFEGTDSEEKLLRSELRFSLDNESVMNPVDFFDRRTGRLYFDIDSVMKYKNIVIDDLVEYFGWDENQRNEEEDQLEQKIFDVTHFFTNDFV